MCSLAAECEKIPGGSDSVGSFFCLIIIFLFLINVENNFYIFAAFKKIELL